jgi:hypothetical protein
MAIGESISSPQNHYSIEKNELACARRDGSESASPLWSPERIFNIS